MVVWHDRDPDDPIALARQAGLEKLLYNPWVPGIFNPLRRPVDTLTRDELVENYAYALRTEGFIPTLPRSGEPDPLTRIATFDEFVTWTASHSELRAVFLDVKLAADQTHLAEVMAEEIADRTASADYNLFVISPHEPIVVAFRSWFAESRPHHSARLGALDATVRLHLDALSIGTGPLRSFKSYIDEIQNIVAHRNDLDRAINPVVGWTIDDEGQLAALLDAGIDGIMTNRPASLARLVEERADDPG